MNKQIVLVNHTSINHVGLEYQPIIDCVVNLLKDSLKEYLVEIRLLGSVPRGDAIPPYSDIDFLAVTRISNQQGLPQPHQTLLEDLCRRFPIVSKIDIQYMSEDDIDRHFDFKLIVMTDSICVYGEDNYTVAEYSILNTELADLWNPNLDSIICNYRTALASSLISKAEIVKYSRLTGKDMMKCFQRKILLDFGRIEKSIEKIYFNLVEHYPGYVALFDKLWKLYRYPTDDREAIVAIIEECERTKNSILD